jgi:uncharacterized protein (TIGR03067 family)
MKKLAIFLLIGLMVAATTSQDSWAGKEQDKPEGKWKLTSRIPSVNATTGISIEFGQFVIGANGGRLEVKGDKLITWIGKEATELTVVFDPSKSPKTVDAWAGKDRVVFRGIYELGKDSLRLCISGKGERPKEFKNTPDTPLFEYKRE